MDHYDFFLLLESLDLRDTLWLLLLRCLYQRKCWHCEWDIRQQPLVIPNVAMYNCCLQSFLSSWDLVPRLWIDFSRASQFLFRNSPVSPDVLKGTRRFCNEVVVTVEQHDALLFRDQNHLWCLQRSKSKHHFQRSYSLNTLSFIHKDTSSSFFKCYTKCRCT